MFLNSKINTKEEFEKYLFLLDLDDIKLSELNYVIRCFQNYEKEYFDFESKYINIVNKINNMIKINDLNLKDFNKVDDINFINDLIKNEIIKNKKYLNYLKGMLNNNIIFLIDTFRENLDNGKVLKKELIVKLKNHNNKQKIENIISKINEMDKSVFNKEHKNKRIIILEKQLINDIEILLNQLCFIFNVKYKNKDIKSKYFSIMDLIKNNIENYKKLKEINNSKLDIFEKIDNLKLDLDINDIKKISYDSLDFLLGRLRLYEMHKKDNRVKISFMVR